MNKPFLFIDTPRAGKHNHRFIIPTDYKDGDSLLSQFADTARKQPEAAGTIISTKGIYFLATGKEASQTSGGRIGWEQLILVNVDVKRLSPEQIANINSFLQQHLEKIELLVTKTIDWNKINPPIMVPREELNQWLQQLEKKVGTLPAIQQPPKPAIERNWYKNPINLGIAAMIGLGCIVIAFSYSPTDKNKGTSYQEQEKKTAEKQVKRLIAAIGGNREDVKKELTPFALPDANAKIVSDTWKINLGDKIKDSGPWSVSMFFQNIDGNSITTGLWGKNIDQLQIADTAGSLQPLVQCRIAIRKLMGIEEAVYTPFFKPEDFNAANNHLTAVENKIYAWTNLAHPDAVRVKDGCDTKPKTSENLLHWIEKCVKPIEGGFAKDKELQNIKKVGEQCRKVEFISPTAPK